MNKFIDISANFQISIAVSSDETYYSWGLCNDELITTPTASKYKTHEEIYLSYNRIACKQVMGKLFIDYHYFNTDFYNWFFEEVQELKNKSYGIVCKARYKKDGKYSIIKKNPINIRVLQSFLQEFKIKTNLKSDYTVQYFNAWLNWDFSVLNDLKKFKDNINFNIQMEYCE